MPFEAQTLGPVQMLVVALDRTRFEGEIMPELERLKDDGLIRVLDLLFVTKEDGELEVIEAGEIATDEATEPGTLIGALVGLGAGDGEVVERAAVVGAAELEGGDRFADAEVWYLADAIPEGTSAAVVLVEHRWAIPLRDKVLDAGGIALADEWIHPADLAATGVAAAAEGVPATT